MVRQEIKKFYMDCGGHKGLECLAPCTLYSVLHDRGIISDPSLSDNISELSRYAEAGCVFYTDFEITPLVMSMKNIYMRFAGLDTVCRIEINGKEIATTDNMHRTYDFEVKTKLILGMNTLKMTFSKPVFTPHLRKGLRPFGGAVIPELCDMGIFRKIEIIAFNHKIISNVKVKQTHTDDSVRLDLKINTVGYDELSRAVATMTSPAGNVYFCGFVGGEGSITITDPNLWWPNGLGMQNLYKLSINLYSESDLEDTYEMKIGLRTVSMSCEDGARTLMINGTPMFVMGGEYMPEDVLVTRVSERKTRALLEDARRANFNSILIHGSGYYPDNYFFDACDELGLAVFAEVPLEDVSIEDSREFADNVKMEIIDNFIRVAHHASLAVIVGSERVSKLFASDEDARRFADGLSNFDGMHVFDLNGECKKNLTFVGHSSLPTYDTVMKFTNPENRNIGSRLFELHGADHGSVVRMLSGAYTDYPYANGMKELSYVMGLYSADASMREVQAARREKQRPLGVIMHRMNDIWPSLSPSAVDYYGGRKPLHYYEREFFAPVRISVVKNGTRVKFIVSNDMRQDYVGVFAYAIMNNKNQPVFRDSFPIRARASSNLEVHNADLGSVISGHEEEYYISYSVSDKSSEASKGTYLFTNTKRFNFLKPEYNVDIIGNGMEYIANVGADCFVKGVEISFEGEDVTVDRNYFDITGKATVRIHLTTPRMTTVEKLKRVMKIRSVYDLGREG
jgi:beta-mannosidase